MKLRQAAKALAAGAVLLSLWGGSPGCGPTAEGYCTKRCDCEPCDDATRELCVSAIEESQTQARDKSCESELNDYLSCLDRETQCVAGTIDDDGCEVELDALKACGVFLGNVCDKYLADYTAKLNECGIENQEPGTIDCTPQLAKQAACLDGCLPGLDCQCLLDGSNPGCQDNIQQYQDCVLQCAQ